MADLEEEIMQLISEHLEGRIESRRFRELEKLLAEKPKVRSLYRDMVFLRTSLEKLFRQEKPCDTAVGQETRE